MKGWWPSMTTVIINQQQSMAEARAVREAWPPLL